MRLRERKDNSTKQYTEIDEEYIDVDYEKQLLLLEGQRQKKQRIVRNSKPVLQYEIVESSSNVQNEEENSFQNTPSSSAQTNQLSLINPQIQFIVSRKKTLNIEDQEQQLEDNYVYLVKYKNKSYYRCKWLSREQLQQQNYEINTQKLKGMHARMTNLKRMRLSQQEHFNPFYLVPDRILNSTDVFSAIHHKKANQIKGTWHESVQIACTKLLNFEKNSFPYGTLLIDEISSITKQQPLNLNPIYQMQVILNRLYFCFYKNYEEVWIDIGKAVNKFIKEYSRQSPDYQIVGNTLRQAALFLYVQWYILSLERFKKAKQQFQENINLLVEDTSITNIRMKNQEQARFCNKNVFLVQKAAQKPKSLQQLDQLNPGVFAFTWMTSQLTSPLKYQYINELDMQQLDLNVETDKFYLVKWKELSYAHCTWERESIFGHPEKIEEYRNINKMPNKEVREGLEVNLKIHNQLINFYAKNKESIQKGRMKKPINIESAQERLYCLKKRHERPVKEYKGKDVIIFKNYKLLKEFQNQSLNWFIKNWYENRNTILADEMGLGKTIQIIAFLYHLYMHEKVLGPFLVLAPLTTLPQWRRQIQNWTNFNCLLYYDQGQSEGRSICQTYEFHYLHTKRSGDLVESSIPKFHILLTNYENFLKDFDSLKAIAFQHIVVDEAHKMKNAKCQLSQALRQLPCLRKTLLTGTPIQNNTKELWSLLNYIEPINFSNEQNFTKNYGSLNTQGQVANIKRMLKPFLLRRVKEDVEKLIPKLSQVIIDVEMTKIQKTIYKSILEKNKGDIIRGLAEVNYNNIAMQFRKCCNHPFLLGHQLQKQLLSDCATQDQKSQKYENSSGKMILLHKLLSKFKQQNKKALVFSQFVIMLDLINQFLEMNNFRCEMLHGGVSASNRHRSITRFSESGEVDVFLISTKAGGVGINLTAATEIIIFDSDWNPQNDIQATARAHRIGQKNQVTVYRLITSNSYEAEMFEISARKLGMDKAIFSGDFFKTSKNVSGAQFEQAMTKTEIETLLKKGVLGFLQNSNNQQDYFKQDIDQILSKNARKIEYSLTGDKNYTYSKSKFVGDPSSKGLDINSSNFWEVALKDIQSPIQRLAKKLDDTSSFEDTSKQQQLMLEAMQIVSDFVKIRVSGSAFNAEDERILYKFLGKISQSRLFNRQYRQIADKLVEQIEKPSRRFKVTGKEIRSVRGGTLNQPIENEAMQEQSEPQQSYIQNRHSEEIKGEQIQRKRYRNKNEKRSNNPYKLTDKNQIHQPQQGSKLRIEYEKICQICLKPKCSIFCKGVCKRSFHKLCWIQYLKGVNTITLAIELKEMGMDFGQWSQQIDRQKMCLTCMSNQNNCTCSICGEEGTLYDQKKAIDNYSDSMTNCKHKNCDRFYHIKCLSQNGKFSNVIIQANKKNGKGEQIHIDKFICPVHVCIGCCQRISKTSWQNLHSCVKCCKTYHPKCLANAEGYIHLNDNFYICDEHLQRPARIALQKDYKLINSDKKSLKELKKMEKFEKNKIIQQKKLQKIEEVQRERDAQLPYTYQDFQIAEISEFDYSSYEFSWCRYCGSRFTEKFCDGPWGPEKLCLHHYKFWKKGKLDLSNSHEEPLQPISRKETEIRFLNKVAKEKNLRPLQLIDLQLNARIQPTR